jgi:serine protease AprX
MPDGRSWTYYNEPTIVATGVDIVSTRTLTGALPPLEAQHDAERCRRPSCRSTRT